MEINEPEAGYSIQNYDFNDGTSEIIRCAIEVHKTLGAGFLVHLACKLNALSIERLMRITQAFS